MILRFRFSRNGQGLFAGEPDSPPITSEPQFPCLGESHRFSNLPAEALQVSDDVLDVLERAENPRDPAESCGLFIGRVEASLGSAAIRSDLIAKWHRSRRRRQISRHELLQSPVLPGFVKELFNFYFRDDLYGKLRSDETMVLSSGSYEEAAFPLPDAMKQCISFALSQDWYGYSDSLGRTATKAAIAELESAKSQGATYGLENIAVTMGGTAGINGIAQFLRQVIGSGPADAICGIPNYPPLVSSIARCFDAQLVPTPAYAGRTDISAIRAAIRPSTKLILLQTVTNPTGTRVPEDDLSRLIGSAPDAFIILDECHECCGAPIRPGKCRSARNVIRVSSLSKKLAAPGLKLGWLVADAQLLREYYEFASSSYGGPVSLFYLLLEVYAKFERWSLEGMEDVAARHLREFEPAYGIVLSGLQSAYHAYRVERCRLERSAIRSREYTTQILAAYGVPAIEATHSPNLLVCPQVSEDSYTLFRRTLGATGVAVYPGILSFCFSGSRQRISPCVDVPVLETALGRIGSLWKCERYSATA